MKNKTKFLKCIEEVACYYEYDCKRDHEFCTHVALRANEKYDLNCNANTAIQNDFNSALDDYFNKENGSL